MRDAGDERTASVACIVLNWNGWRDTLVCLDSLAQLGYERLEIVVVDNGSTDESVRRIRETYPHITLLETHTNLGFGGGTNVGLRHALAGNCDYVWLVNNDAQPQPGALAALLDKARSNPLLGAIGSRLCYAHDRSKVQAWAGGRINRWTGRTAHAISSQDDAWFDYITCASALLPRRALEDVGLFDESFFLYWEDGDLCVRLLERGWLLGVAPDSIVLHKENASTGGNRSVIDRYSTASGIRFLSKHARVPWISIPVFLALRISKRLVSGQLGRLRSVLAGVRDYRLKRRVPPQHDATAAAGNGRLIVYGAFKGMGDLLSAAPVIAAQLNQAARVVLLVFPQIAAFAELLDFGANAASLQVCPLPVGVRSTARRHFLRRMARLSPDLLWLSPHTPLAALSWKIPLLLGLIKKWCWPRAIYAGARTERFSWLFDRRVEVERTLPLGAREVQAFSQLAVGAANIAVAPIAFKQRIQRQRALPALYDILIHPGASAQNRQWPFARYRELLPLLPVGSRVVVVGLPQDIAGVRAELPADSAVSFLGGSLEAAIVAMARSRAALTMDSGTMFFAAMLGVPTVSLFGPSQPAQVIPAAGRVVPIHTASCRCRPGSKTCRWQPAPCMASIDAGRVAEEVARILQHAGMSDDLRVGQR